MATKSLAAPFVRSDCDALAAALVIPPSPAIVHATPLHGESNAIPERAREQHGLFVGRLRAHGVAVTVLESPGDEPLQAVASDLAVVFPQGAFITRPSDLKRRGQAGAVESALGVAGVPVVGRIEAPGLFDGGDAVLIGDTLYLGVVEAKKSDVGLFAGVHGNALGREQLGAYARGAGYNVVEVTMAAECRRLRAVVAPLDAATVVIASALVDPAPFAKLTSLDVPRGEDYAAGVLPLGHRTVLQSVRFRETLPFLRKAKFSVDAIDLYEFGKIGATPATLTLALKRG